MLRVKSLLIATIALNWGCGAQQEKSDERSTDESNDSEIADLASEIEGGETLKASASCGTLKAGESLKPKELLASCDGRFYLLNSQVNGALQLAKVGQGTIWSINLGGEKSAKELVMQNDGNLVYYRSSDGAAIWHTNTWKFKGAKLVMQNDGNLVVYGPKGVARWASGTAGR